MALSRTALRELLAPLVAGAGFDLEDVNVRAAGRRSLVQVVVDRDEGLDLDAVAEVSRLVSQALDDADSGGGAPYTLEVSSPGIDRPLTEPRHWRRNVGRLVATGVGTGRVCSADDTGVTLEHDGEQRHHSYADLGTGRVQVEFGRADAEEDA